MPLYLFSQKELAPVEDQGVVFGIVQASANSTLDQTKLFAAKVDEVYRSFPETANTFEITFPTGGFGGMVTKPWSERKKTHAAAAGRGVGEARGRSRACASSR